MHSIKFTCAILITLLMVGCAGYQPKPEMPAVMYEQIGDFTYQVVRCNEMGMITPELAATGSIAIQTLVRRYTVDEGQLVAAASRTRTVDQASCNKVAMEIATYQQRSAAQLRYNAPAPQPNYSLPGRTVCNNIAGQLLCSTY